jgi:AcrR family transcriptional regulator
VATAGPKRDGRRERSRLTRRRVVDAATRLFVDHGYVATTIENVAEHAGVAVQTVYYVFGTKRNLLGAVLDASIAGDVEPIPVLERVWAEELREGQDVTAAVQRLVDESVSILARTTPVYEVVRRAAADPEVAALLEDTRKRRRADQRALIGIVLQSGRPETALDADAAADVFYGLINEEVFQLLVGDCGWSVARFRSWATSLMLHQLWDSTGARGS